MNQIIPIKLVIIGDGSIGKTCILLSYTTDKFPDKYVPTVFDNFSAKIKVDGKSINLGLWDTAGQEEFNKLRPLSYPQTDVFIIAFSVVDANSFENALKKWYPELQENAPGVPIVFVGNKIDLREKNPEIKDEKNSSVTYMVANKVVTELGCKYLECSALSQEGLQRVFEESMRTVLQKREQIEQDKNIKLKTKRLRDDQEQNQDKSCRLS